MSNYTYLQHHGIKGQKWGVRRFQNKSGKLTSAGKKRYNAEKLEEKKNDARDLNRYRNAGAYNTTKHIKKAAGGAVTMLGVATVGSITVKALSKAGHNNAAAEVFRYSKASVNALKAATSFELGAAAVNAMMTSPNSFKRYYKEEQRIKNMK